ncbi:MAG: hypothetical protein ACOY5R_22385 [Pseudomonadota bacterium]
MKQCVMIGVMAMLAACGRTEADNVADQLDNAAAQSDPAARPALENAADHLRDGGTGNAGDVAQDALSQGGASQAPNGAAAER